MTDENEVQGIDLNPFYAKVIGFVGNGGDLIDPASVVDPLSLLINVGESDEVKVDERVLIFGLGQEILDPETEESLGHFEIVRGYGKVKSVQVKMAIVVSTETKTVRYQKPQNVNSIVAGLSPEFSERKEVAPFRRALVGDLVRFV